MLDPLPSRAQIGPVKPPPPRCSRRNIGAAAPIARMAPDQQETTCQDRTARRIADQQTASPPRAAPPPHLPPAPATKVPDRRLPSSPRRTHGLCRPPGQIQPPLHPAPSMPHLRATTAPSELVAYMKGHMAKKDADHKNLNDKYQLLVNLTRAQAVVIQNLKLKHTKEKQVHSEAMKKLELKNAELTKSEEKLTQEKLELKFQIANPLMGKEVHGEERGQLELQVSELMKGEKKLKLKLKCILAILQK
ncbi:hypothetical protein ZWY2020_046392 [Hordeum vulgare]|nr:hypothetical protein ZWY2020_046392 [Hordeum vulgare]